MKTLALIFLLIVTSQVFASPSLDDLDVPEIDVLFEEFTHNFTHTTVSPAKSLGKIFGFEVGIVGGIAEAPKLESLAKEVDPNEDIDIVPHAGILGMLTVPYGITAEALLIPKQDFGDVSLYIFSGAAKWTITDVFWDSLPVDIAVRGFLSINEISFNQDINNYSTSNANVNADIKWKNTIYGANLTAGYDFFFLEPYIGAGFIQGNPKVSVEGTGTATIFGETSTLANLTEYDTSVSSGQFFAGLQFDLFLMHLAAEYSNAFGTNRYTAKLSFYF